jgi:metal-responsive CopG/Arc/MetJ family transcriptional regulator
VRVTVYLPGVTPELLDLAVCNDGARSRSEALRWAILAMLERVEGDAIVGPDGKWIGSRSDIEDELFPKVYVSRSDLEIAALRAEIARLEAELRERDGEGWKAGQPEDGEE